MDAAVVARCELCRAWPSRPLCSACAAAFGVLRARCSRCALALDSGEPVCARCRVDPPPLAACHAAVSYGYPWSGLIARFKFQAQPGWSRTLAAVMRRSPGICREAEDAELVLPMPLSRERLVARGFNQALELARHLAGGKVEPRLLLRLRDTPAQARLQRADRLDNVRHAFAVEPSRTGHVRGRRCLLVDDVMTSGASLHACARALEAAGAARVAAVVLARAED